MVIEVLISHKAVVETCQSDGEVVSTLDECRSILAVTCQDSSAGRVWMPWTRQGLTDLGDARRKQVDGGF